MAADSQRQEASSNDLFGRWLAHHEQQATEQGDDAAVDDITAESSPPPRASRRLPTAAVASSAVERDPMIGSRIAAPSTFGVRRPSPQAPAPSGPVNELDREPPPGWEPIVMRSIRKKAEQAEAKQVPKPADGRSRLQRLKARLVDPPESEAVVETPLVPLTPPVARSVPLPTPQPKPPLPTRTPANSVPAAPAVPAAPVAPAARSLEETIRAAVPVIERQVARHAEPRVEDQPVEAAPVEAPPVEAPPVEAHVARHAEPRVEPPAELVASVGRHLEPEEVAPPRPVRAFIAVDPEPVQYVEPDPVVAEPEPVAVAVEPEPVVEPVVEPVAESVVVEAEPEPVFAAEPVHVPAPAVTVDYLEDVEDTDYIDDVEDVQDVGDEDSVDSEPADEQPARRSFLSLPRRQPRDPKPREPRETGREDRPRDAARDLVAAKARARAASLAPQPLTAAPQVVMPVAQHTAVAVEDEPEPEAEPAKVSKHDEVATEMPGVYKFATKRTSRRLLTIALLIGIALSAYFVRAALEVKETPAIGLAAIVVLATVMVWAIRGGASVTTMEVHQGQLQVVQQGGRYIFDLASQYTKFEVHGQPGRRNWKVLFPRRGMTPFTVDASMVDPDDFMRVLRFFRPQLVHH